MSYMDWQAIQSEAGNTSAKIVKLSPFSLAILLSSGALYRDKEDWISNGQLPTSEEFDVIEGHLGQMEYELMSGLIGMIIPNVISDYTGLNILPCDGSQYLRTDYPELYSVIDSAYHIDADNFRVPDLRDKFTLGAGVNNVGDTGGSSEHTLTIGELPSHSHTYTSPTFNVDIESVGVPDPTGVGNPPQLLSTSSVGGSEAHNNMPPYETIKFGIVAR